MMLIVGITGRSGSGKSSLARYYATLGYPVEDGDELSRFVCAPGSPCLKQLCAAFGPAILDENGGLLRQKLGERVFGDPRLNQTLIDIVHPFVLEELIKREKIAEQSGARLFFLDGAMLVGSIFQAHCHRIIVVESEKKLSISRIILRDGISKAAAHSRLNAQKSPEELRLAADYLVENNGTEEHLQKAADAILPLLLAQALPQ